MPNKQKYRKQQAITESDAQSQKPSQRQACRRRINHDRRENKGANQDTNICKLGYNLQELPSVRYHCFSWGSAILEGFKTEGWRC
jgi:hypothetical protein